MQDWNPVTLAWDTLDPTGLDLKERIAQAYWMAKLALFEKSGIGAFGTAMLKAAVHDMEDPTKKVLAAVRAVELAISSAQTFLTSTMPQPTLRRKRSRT